MGKLVLGLDLGPNSIGWALINDDPENPAKSKLINLGVRVFPEGVDNFDTSKELSRNEDRRIARGMRRQIRRRAKRRHLLKQVLIDLKLWPHDSTEETKLCESDPYELRAAALSRRLEPFEIGRVLLHLNQRRGFLSNRKKDRGDKEVQGMLAEINENEREREEGGFQTLGAWLADKEKRRDHTNRKEGDHTRHRHLAREQYEDEFEAIWNAQSKYHETLLTEDLKYGKLGKQKYPTKPIPRWHERRKDESILESFGIHGLIFFQRPMYWPKSVVGLCELEPKEKRCQRSDRRNQRFRLLQEVNNLKYIDPDTHTEQKLDDKQRRLLIDKLSRTNELPFDQIRKTLGFLESVKFNLERGARSKLKGVPIDALFAAKKVLGADWYDRPEQQRTEIVAVLLDNERDDDRIITRAIAEWEMTAEEAEAMLSVDLPAGYASLSSKAIEKLLPHMERGLLYMDDDESNSAMHAALYFRRDQLRRRMFDILPDPARTPNCPIGDIPNPVVKRTLTEVRKVVNAIVREYGKPDAIHIELARSVQMGKEKRSDYSKMIRDREAERDGFAEKLRENGVRVTGDNILKYQLWEQQGQECIYSGKPISFEKLFGEGGGVEVDHILPRSRSLDKSQGNRIICLRAENVAKGDHTPYEWLADAQPDRYEQVCQRAGMLMRSGRMPYAKYRRFIQRELELDKFVARQLTDTGYITKATMEYLRYLCEKDHEVLGLKGQLTAELRYHWGLETVLEELPDSPAWHEADSGKLRPGEKNRADHRHHAIDAVVIALTNRRRLHQLSDIVKRGGAKAHGEILEDPWPNFREDIVEAIKNVNVSYRVERKVAGPLHADSLYWPTEVKGEFVKRKPLAELSPSEIDKIRDEGIKALVVKCLRTVGIESGRGVELDKKSEKAMKAALSNVAMASGVPVKKVRLRVAEKTIRPIRLDKPGTAFVKPDSTHHLCIFEWEENGGLKRDAIFVSMLEATNRIRSQNQELSKRLKKWKESGLSQEEIKTRKLAALSQIAKLFPIIERDPGKLEGDDRQRIPPNARFVMSLANREMILVDWKGTSKLLTLKTAVSTSGQMRFAEHTDARKSKRIRLFRATASTLVAKKVTVDPLGRIRWAND